MPSTATPPHTPLPRPGETQVAYFRRADQALAGQFKRQAERSVRILKLWQRCEQCSELREAASELFPDSEYTHVGPVPVWSEHTYTDPDGNETRYDLPAIQSIVDRCNERILDTGDFPPITDGHTPTEDQKQAGAKQPDVLGFAGPFYVGRIGNKNPRWAIFADEHWRKEDADRLKRLPRRSPEVWLEERMEDRFLDPIAALGAETPRLDSGISRNHRTSDGRLVAKYSGAAFPAGGNTALPHTTKRRDAAGEQTMPLAQEDVKQIVDAIMQTEPMQWVVSQMGSGAPAGSGGDKTSDDDESIEQYASTPAGNRAMWAQVDENDSGRRKSGNGYAKTRMKGKWHQTYAAGPASDEELAEFDDDERGEYDLMDDGEKAAYMAVRRYAAENEGEPAASTPPPNAQPAQYSRSNPTQALPSRAEIARYQRENRELTERIKKLEQRNTAQARYSRLSELAHDYVFDVDEELADVEALDDQQFTRHCERIVARYSRRPNEGDAAPLYTPHLPSQRGPKHEDVMRYHREATDVMNARGITYAEAAQVVKTKHNLDYDLV